MGQLAALAVDAVRHFSAELDAEGQWVDLTAAAGSWHRLHTAEMEMIRPKDLPSKDVVAAITAVQVISMYLVDTTSLSPWKVSGSMNSLLSLVLPEVNINRQQYLGVACGLLEHPSDMDQISARINRWVRMLKDFKAQPDYTEEEWAEFYRVVAAALEEHEAT